MLGKLLSKPSVSYGPTNLYAHGVFEAETRPNLARRLAALVPEGDGATLTLNDRKLKGPMRVRLSFKASAAGASDGESVVGGGGGGAGAATGLGERAASGPNAMEVS